MTCRQHRNFGIQHNPEAPTDGLEDHWHEPPNKDGSWWSIILAMLVSVAACGMMVYACSAPASELVLVHMHDRPSLDQWLMSLYSKHRGGCCDNKEAETMADPDWRNVKDVPAGTCKASDINTGLGEDTTHKSWLVPAFCVRLESPYDHTWTWWEVPESAIVDEPNKAGPALIWIFWSANRLPYIRCFLPGSLS